MTSQNWRAARRAQLWERLCRLSDELQELTCLWWEEDPDIAGWETHASDEPTHDPSQPPTTREPQHQPR